ncbi:uncharacterized protein BO88DRAFT_435096 [Aspergillus vadensis CBS 113365]|uniref:Uncharacterized protein n=1 Tax=Aspergillus vadensis (strain CBS 113365 / IMI 142717 / IBT 24658) TaxID=1448311 RepID=A0A319BC83_ASPVC|nr:hypothetical protein BO88DRAFT_435096 [Aspergillus vadensis CBS 113365]PYH69544.1 hypothetical protein BO88DRAFT_435096 [Aspergillus vadensis CBS 113365]
MDNIPSEVVFSTGPLPSESVVFQYTNGPLKISPPKRRGRPAGSTKRKQHLEGSRAHPAAASNFKFINLGPTLAPTDEEERTTIRSHKMNNRTRQDQRKAESTPGDTNLELSRLTHIHIPHAYPQRNQTDPFDALPITMEPYMFDLFAFYDYWVPMLFQDPAMLHVVLACGSLFTMDLQRFRASPAFIWHISRAMSIVRKRLLNSVDSPSDETIVAVASIAIAKKAAGQHDQWEVDMRILKALVDMRGGLDALNDNPMVQGKIYRADISGSLDGGRKPIFSDRFQQPPISGQQAYHLAEGFQELDVLLRIDRALKAVIYDIQSLVEEFSSITKSSGQTVVARIRFWMTSLQYTLLSMQYGDDCSRTQALEVCRLSLLLLINAVFHESPPGASTSDVLISQLRRLLGNAEALDWFPPSFRLWTLYLAACNVASPTLRAWSVAAIAELVMQIGISDEEEFSQQLTLFPFDPLTQNVICPTIWNEVQYFVQNQSGGDSTTLS